MPEDRSRADFRKVRLFLNLDDVQNKKKRLCKAVHLFHKLSIFARSEVLCIGNISFYSAICVLMSVRGYEHVFEIQYSLMQVADVLEKGCSNILPPVTVNIAGSEGRLKR